jgi:hypothetical protein
MRFPDRGGSSNLWYLLPAMSQPVEPSKSQSVLSAILTDVHFWIPAAVLLFGLWVLHWTR